MSEWNENDISVNGLRLHYHRTGGSKPTLILAHGVTDNGLCWTRLARALESQFDLIMVDARGHGLSDKPDQGYGAADHADDLSGLIDALDLDKPVLIGHSMGAVVAAILTDRKPDRVSRLVLEDPAWYPRDEDITEEEIIAHARDWSEAIAQRNTQSAEKVLAKARQDHPLWDAAEFPPFVQAKLQVSPHVTEYDLVPAKPWWEIVPALQCPTLILSGGKVGEVAVTPAIDLEIRTLNPKIQIARLSGAGHTVRRDQFEEYLWTLRGFLSA